MVELAVLLALAFFALPFVSFWRTIVLSRRIDRLEGRLRELATPPQGPPASRREASPVPPETPRLPAMTAAASSGPVPPEPRVAPAASAVVRQGGQTTPSPTSRRSSDDLEALLAGRWMLYAGLLVLLLGVAFFLKYAFDHAWINPRARCAIGALAGLGVIPVGLRLASRGYERYGQLLAGAGIVILYLTTYAALNLYALIPRPAAAAAFVLIAVAGGVLADRHRALPLAMLAVLGGYATPLLVGGTRDAQITLFSYMALLAAATIALARRRDWHQLSAVSYALTVFLLLVWADAHYSPDKYLRTELFLTLYCGLFLWALAGVRGGRPRSGRMPLAVLATAPLLYYGASLAILWEFRLELFVFLILVSGTALALSVAAGLDSLRLAAWAAAALPFLGRLEATGPEWTTAMLTTGAAIVIMHLAAQVHRLGKDTPVLAADVLLLHGNGVFAIVAAYAIFQDQWLAGAPWLAWGLGAGFAALAWGIRRVNLEAALHWSGLALALLGAGVALRFDGPWVIVTVAAEGAAIAWIGLRVQRAWFRTVGLLAVALACWQWFSLATSGPVVSEMLLVNGRTAAGALIVALVYALATWHRRTGGDPVRLFAPLIVAAQVVTVAVLTAEASSYWHVRSLARSDAGVAEQLSISLIWAAYAAGLVVVGLRRRLPPLRYVGIGLFGLTVGKVFVADLARLAGFYRVAGFLVVGAVLVLVAFLYQRASKTADAPDTVSV
jgi:hypothetical protein